MAFFKNILARIGEYDDVAYEENTEFYDQPSRVYSEVEYEQELPMQRNRMQNSSDLRHSLGQQVIIVKPTSVEEALQVITLLHEKKTIVVNFEQTKGSDMIRIVDVLNGAIFALNGSCLAASEHIVVYAPQGVSLVEKESDYVDAEKEAMYR